MEAKNLTTKVLFPGYGIIVAASIVENLFFRSGWFMLGSLVGLLWLLPGLVGLFWALRELKKGEGYLLVQSGPFALSRNPIMASNLLAVMPGLCLILNTNLGIIGIATAVYLFHKYIYMEEMALEDQFGEAYQAYKERVSRLVPCSSASAN